MGATAFRAIGNAVRSFCSILKAFLFPRLKYDSDRTKAAVGHANLSDKNTFFAWQRNHMANERTFLSWCRTGISLIAFGFIIERFDILIREMKFVAPPGLHATPGHMISTRYLGMVALGLGVAIILLAGWRFFYIRKHIDSGDPHFSVLPDTFLLGSVLLTVAASFVFFAFYF